MGRALNVSILALTLKNIPFGDGEPLMTSFPDF